MTTSTMHYLNLGCGDSILPGYLNVDRYAWPGVDMQADLNQDWPLSDGSMDFILAQDVIEHLADKVHTLNELWRVLSPQGQVKVVVPTTDGSGAFQDPTHVSYWNRRSFLYVTADNPYHTRFAEAYGLKAKFNVLREHVDTTPDGPKLTIWLQAVKP